MLGKIEGIFVLPSPGGAESLQGRCVMAKAGGASLPHPTGLSRGWGPGGQGGLSRVPVGVGGCRGCHGSHGNAPCLVSIADTSWADSRGSRQWNPDLPTVEF